MALTMRHESKLAIGLALMLASSGVLLAQVNPTTPISAARNAALQVQTPPPAKTQDKKPSAPPASNQTTPPKPAASAPANQTSKPPATKPPVTKAPAANASVNPPAPKKPDTKPPVTNATPKPPVTQAQSKPTNAPPKTPPSKAAAKPAPKTGKSAEATKTASAPARRDPFITLIGKESGGPVGPAIKLPPGIGGLQVSTLILQGIVSGPTGMIAVVANPQRSVYFLHVGDKLFDGNVEHIEIGAVTFHETGKDAFGKPLEREVVRRLNSSSGEQP